MTIDHETIIKNLNMHDGYRINDELTAYRVPGGLLYVSYKEEILEAGPGSEQVKIIKRVPTSSTFVPYN